MKSNSLYRGVQKRNGGKWGATIYDSKKRSQIWLGTFDTAEAAALAYDEAAVRFHGDRARLNFPERFLCEPLRPVITSNLQVIDPNLTLGVNGNNIPNLERFFLGFGLSLENIVFSPGEELGIGEGEVALEKQHDNPGEEFGIGEIGLDHMNVVHTEENIVDINEECIINSSQSPHRRGGIDISREELEEVSGMKRKDAAKSLDVSVSTFKRVCRDHHISRWPPRKRNTNQSFLTKSDQTDCLVTIKAKYGENFIKFQLSALSGVDVLTQEVSKRLKVDVADYIVKYQDDENDWILVACDDDLQGYISSSLSSGKTTLVMLIEHI